MVNVVVEKVIIGGGKGLSNGGNEGERERGGERKGDDEKVGEIKGENGKDVVADMVMVWGNDGFIKRIGMDIGIERNGESEK